MQENNKCPFSGYGYRLTITFSNCLTGLLFEVTPDLTVSSKKEPVGIIVVGLISLKRQN